MPYIGEWVDYHLNLGVDRITLYINEPGIEPYRNLLPHKEVEFVEWNRPMSEDFRPQIRAYDHFVMRNQREDDYTFLMDVDEYITPPTSNTQLPLSALMDKMRKLNRDGLVLPWICYNANGQLRYEDRPVVERFTQISPYYSTGAYIKSFFKNTSVLYVSSHLTRTKRTTVDQSDNDKVSPHYNEYGTSVFDYCKERGWWYLRHYYTKSWVEFVQRRVQNPRISRGHFQHPDLFFAYNPDMAYLKEDLVKSLSLFAPNDILGCVNASST